MKILTLNNVYENRDQFAQLFTRGMGFSKFRIKKSIKKMDKKSFMRFFYKNFHLINKKIDLFYPKFDYAGNFNNGYSNVKYTNKEGKKEWGYIDENLNIINLFDPSLYHVKKTGEIVNGFGVINVVQKKCIEKNCEYVSYFYFLTQEIFMTVFEKAGNFIDGLAYAKRQDSKYGYINNKFEFVIQPQFDCAWDFVNGIAKVKVGDKYGFINKSGNFVIEPIFILASSFDKKGYAKVITDNNNMYLIDKNLNLKLLKKNVDYIAYSQLSLI
jgi:hypothetical protein